MSSWCLTVRGVVISLTRTQKARKAESGVSSGGEFSFHFLTAKMRDFGGIGEKLSPHLLYAPDLRVRGTFVTCQRLWLGHEIGRDGFGFRGTRPRAEIGYLVQYWVAYWNADVTRWEGGIRERVAAFDRR
jgi:hypothetical protein